MRSLSKSVQAHINGMTKNTLTSAGECVQVAAVWQTAEPAASVETSGNLKMASGTNKALADAQKQLRISQQQASTFLHMAAGFHWCIRHDILLCSLCLAASSCKASARMTTMLDMALAVTHCTSASQCTHITEESKHPETSNVEFYDTNQQRLQSDL